VLAGGESRRMGRDKLVLEVGGVPLLRRVRDALLARCAEVIVVGGGAVRLEGVRRIPDERRGLGPLAGMEAGLAAARNRTVFVAAGDRVLLSDLQSGFAAVEADVCRSLYADVVELVSAATGGRVAGCPAAVLDPARRAGGRRVLDPDRWSPPWSTVRSLLERVPVSVVKVAPGLDHDRVPDGVEAEWVSVGGSIVEALLWGRDRSTVWRRATVVRPDGRVHELTAPADPGRAPSGPVQGWLHEPDPAVIRSGLVATVAGELGATLVDPQIAYLTSAAAGASPWVTSYPVTDVLPFSTKRLKALLRARGVGRVTVKKRGSAIEPEALVHQLRGPGDGHAVVVVTRVADAPTAIVCGPPS